MHNKEGDITVSVRKPHLKKRTPHVVHEASSVEVPHRDAEDQPCPSFASPLLEMDDNWDALRDWGPSPTADDYAFVDEIRPEYLPRNCPGWGQFDIDSSVCGLCRWNVDCMTAEVKRNEPSCDQ